MVLMLCTLSTSSFLYAKESADEAKSTTNASSLPAGETSQPASNNKSKANNSPVKPPIDSTKQYKADIKHYMASEEVRPLLAGPDDYITLFKKSTSANSKGIAILIPEWQQGATNPKAINYLRNALPSQGWSTLAVQPENKPQGYPSSALTLAEQKKENKRIIEAYQRKLNTLFSALMNTAKDYPGIVLVIAQGNNGALLIDTIAEEDSQQPNALILLSSYRQTNLTLTDSVNEHFALQLAYTELPILDLYLKFDNTTVLATAPKRKLIAQQEMKTYYRQRQLNNTITGYYPEQELLSQINSWLKSIGW